MFLHIETLGDLKRKKHALVQDLQQIAKGVKKLRRQLPTGGQLQISAAQRTAARALMVMRDGEPTAAMAFLWSQRKAADPDATCWAEMESDLREWWMHAGEDRKNKQTNVGDTHQSKHNAIKQAKRFIVEEELKSWAAHQNASEGINPVPTAAFQEARVATQRIGVEAPPTHRVSRQWLQRWRRRRGLRLRRYRPGAPGWEGFTRQGQRADAHEK